MSKPMIEYKNEITYSTLVRNHIGTCSDSTLRSIASHNDSNARYFATSGVDTNLGTKTSPKASLESAVSAAIASSKTRVICLDDTNDFDTSANLENSSFISIEADTSKTPTLIYSEKWNQESFDRTQSLAVFDGNLYSYAGADYDRKKTDTSWSTFASTGEKIIGYNADKTRMFSRRFLSPTSAVIPTTEVDYSDNGTTWTNITSPSNFIGEPHKIFEYKNKLYLGYDGGLYVSSDNGVNWTEVLFFDSYNCFDLCEYLGFLYVATNKGVLRTNDGVSWIHVDIPTSIYTKLISFKNKLFAFAVKSLSYQKGGKDEVILSSENGYNFDYVIDTLKGGYFYEAFVYNGVLYAVSFEDEFKSTISNVKAHLYYSVDGEHFTKTSFESIIPRPMSGTIFPTVNMLSFNNTLYVSVHLLGWQSTGPIHFDYGCYLKSINNSVILINSSNIKINGFKIDGNNKCGVLVQSGKNYGGLELKHCEFDNYIDSAIEINES